MNNSKSDPAAADFLAVAQVADELHLTRRGVVHRINAGTIVAVKLGSGRTSAYMISRSEVDRVAAQRPSAVSA